MWMLSEAQSSPDWIAWSGQTEVLAGDAGHHDRERTQLRPGRTLCATDANRGPSRLSAANRTSWNSLARTRGWGPGSTRWLESKPPRLSLLDPLPLAATEIISTVAGRLPLSGERPIHPKVAISSSLIPKRQSRPPARRHVVRGS